MPRLNSDLGISLIILGAGLLVIGYLILDSTPVFVLGIAVVIMGLLAAWGEGSLERTQLELARSGWTNTSALLESIGTASRAIYLPSSATEAGTSMALVPLVRPEPPSIKLPRGFAIRYGREGESGLLLYTPGSIAVSRCLGVGAISSDVATSLTNCLVNHLTVARGVTAMPSEGGVTVVVRESRVGELYGNELVRAVLGLPTASLVASVVAESLNSPVVIETEEVRGKDVVVKLRVVGGGP
ncbi:hypothetical protein [Vulcanisaeta souniana]|uniref:DUF7982 domain-containing protein n=1 Tax=Vulcanisaeta souniana JCM 11219 TaxID=1293586 RepID=A0A830E3V1_9CREN|nr:hypothetical protein [Vulcanisaeta souniana]BDR92725.1 hypothetical protein Vsou_18180 [Vulcanisaeta souniana JCM 11219]GGI84175.1 hypothetical protein GCM10007112_21330 [Vulcanisaeta souniana JCM 11219]